MNDEDIVALYFEIEKLERRFSAKQKQKHSFSGQYRCLLVLLYNGDMEQAQLAAYMNVRSASISETLLKLEKNGLVERKRSDTDKRKYLVSLTEKGVAQAKENDLNRAKQHSGLVQALTEDEKQQFYNLLTKIKENYQLEEN